MLEITKHIKKLKTFWKTACIPVVSNKRIESVLQNYLGQYINMLKSFKDRKDCKACRENNEGTTTDAENSCWYYGL